MRAQHRPICTLQKSFTASLKNEFQYIKNICKSKINNKNNQQNMFVTLISCHFVTLIGETQIFCIASSANFQEVRAISAESIYCCMLLFLDHTIELTLFAMCSECVMSCACHYQFTVNENSTSKYFTSAFGMF